MRAIANGLQALLLDMDGVLYHGDRAIPGALAFMERLGSFPHAFITNNPILPPGEVADRLQRLGFRRPEEHRIITSAEATALWLSRQRPGFRYFAVGAPGLHRELARRGVEDPAQADFVVIGEGAGIDYAQITLGINLVLKQGARLVCTNPDHSVDATLDGEHRVLPGGGALVAPFAVATGREPTFIGKPAPLLYEMALQRLGVEPAACLMVGDRPDTDIAGAAALGMRTALVRTGRFAPGEALPEGMAPPDWDIANLLELGDIIFGT